MFLSFSAFAEGNEDSAPDLTEGEKAQAAKAVEKKDPSGQKVDEADQVITNRRLRAQSGSLSKWSGNFAYNYNAGSLQKPLAAQRPNITAGANNLTLQNMTLNMGLRYRFSTLNSITFATGAFITAPFNTTINTNNPALKKRFEDTKQQLTVNDPNLIYTNLTNLSGFQIVTQFTPTLITNSQQRHAGYTGSFDWTSTIMKEIGKSGLSLGGALEYTRYFFDKTDKTLGANYLQIYPVGEYVLNETYNLRTVLGYQWEQLRNTPNDNYHKLAVFQSIGLGITVTRNIFLYPNIQFLPSHMKQELTNVGLSAYFNAF
ncbi:MAG: hypothetical protein ACJ76H_00800 [Bacteriovoracaceae bacterium]